MNKRLENVATVERYTLINKKEKNKIDERDTYANASNCGAENTAITLIALIITIIVLLILAAVTLNMVIGDNGIFKKANIASEETNKSQALEELKLKVLEVQTEKDGNATLKDVIDSLNEDEQNLYKVYLETATIVGDIPTITEETEKVYVDYKNYKFKIDNKLIVTFAGESEGSMENPDDEEKIDQGLLLYTRFNDDNSYSINN